MTSTVKPDYWSLLGLPPGSDLKQLKSAFRKEARKWHPDLNKNDSNAEERFKLINEAYAVLSDPKKRLNWEENKEFNISQEDPFKEGFPTYNEYISIVLGLNVNDELNEEIEEEFGDNNIHKQEDVINDDDNYYSKYEKHVPTKSKPSPPPVKVSDDLETIVELDEEEALNGTYVEIELEDGTIVEIATPPFAGDGWRLRLQGLGNLNTDHFIQLRVVTEDGLRIDGLRVLYKLELLPHEALLGCAVNVPTLNGIVTLQVPPRSSTGRLLRLRGQGLKYNDIVGDQYVEIVIVIPNQISESEYALYRRLEELSNNDE
tara:strand:- start:31101 stop:32051 length:951 start_codon:yes stop_codon:yes gene_type:complete